MEKANLSKLRFRGFKYLVLLLMMSSAFTAYAQTTIQGRVKDPSGNPPCRGKCCGKRNYNRNNYRCQR